MWLNWRLWDVVISKGGGQHQPTTQTNKYTVTKQEATGVRSLSNGATWIILGGIISFLHPPLKCMALVQMSGDIIPPFKINGVSPDVCRLFLTPPKQATKHDTTLWGKQTSWLAQLSSLLQWLLASVHKWNRNIRMCFVCLFWKDPWTSCVLRNLMPNNLQRTQAVRSTFGCLGTFLLHVLCLFRLAVCSTRFAIWEIGCHILPTAVTTH